MVDAQQFKNSLLESVNQYPNFNIHLKPRLAERINSSQRAIEKFCKDLPFKAPEQVQQMFSLFLKGLLADMIPGESFDPFCLFCMRGVFPEWPGISSPNQKSFLQRLFRL